MKKELLAVLLKVQKELPIVGKDSKGFNYKYASLPQVWEKVGKVLESNGFFITNEITLEGVLTTAHHEHGELHSFIPFVSQSSKPQEIGSEVTYWRRYNLTAIFNIIVDGEDDDAQTANDAKKSTTTTPKVETGTNTCKDCGKPLTMRKNGNGGYCSGVYSKACPPKPLTASEQKISDEMDSTPSFPDYSDIPTITVDDIN
jgi:hypothetical protein